MIELEVYAKGIRQQEKILGLALELDNIPGLTYKVDSNHDLVYLEFHKAVPSLDDLKSIFNKLELDAKFVGALSPEVRPKAKTERLS